MDISYIITVSCRTGCYRHILIDSTATFFSLHESILGAFEFDDDHAHAFFLDNVAWSDRDSLYSPFIEDEIAYSDQYTLAQKDLSIGKKFKYVFDFGEEWQFQCKILKTLSVKTLVPMIIKEKGESPIQYGDNFDDEEEWDNE